MAKGDAARLRAYRRIIEKLLDGWHTEALLGSHTQRIDYREDPQVVRRVYQRLLDKRLQECFEVEPEYWDPIRERLAHEYEVRDTRNIEAEARVARLARRQVRRATSRRLP